jgi:septal ring factor EnvC (AmiA/AmiB activator)
MELTLILDCNSLEPQERIAFMSKNSSSTQKPVILYLIILVLTAGLLILGVLTYSSVNKLQAMQKSIGELRQTVSEISEEASQLQEKAEQLETLQAEYDALINEQGDTAQ